VPILILLDREADKFLARRSAADAMLVKPIDPGTLRRTVKNLLAAEEQRITAEAAEPAPKTDETPSGPEEQVG
jgi:DNA-binding response OmpR family regulator